MTIRVIRTMEYVYPDIETADQDMARWTWYSDPGWNSRFRSTAMFGPAIDEMEMAEPPPRELPAPEVRVEVIGDNGQELKRLQFADYDWHQIEFPLMPARVTQVRALLIRPT